MRLEITRGAQDDLLDIGRLFIGRLKTRARLAARNPKAGRIVAEWLQDDLREVLVGHYRIIYLVRPRLVIVLAFIEGHRLLRSSDLVRPR